MKIYGMQDNYFLINHYWIPGSVIVFPQRYFMWNVLDASEIKPHTLEIMQFIKPRPDYLIIGTGDETVHFDESFYEHFKRLGIAVDTCSSVSKTAFKSSLTRHLVRSLQYIQHVYWRRLQRGMRIIKTKDDLC